MAGYTRIVKAVTQFDGQEITYHFKRLTRVEFLESMSYISSESVKGGEAGEMEVQIVKGKEFEYIGFMCDLVFKKLIFISGLLIDGEEATFSRDQAGSDGSFKWQDLEELLQEVYFQDLVQEIMGKVLLESQGPSGKEEKKSDNTPSE